MKINVHNLWRSCRAVAILAVMVSGTAHGWFTEEAQLLTSPLYVRQLSMGNVGIALADDESVIFFNPAGLARNSERFSKGSLGFDFDPGPMVYSSWKFNISAAFNPPKLRIGGFGLSVGWRDGELLISAAHAFHLKRFKLENHCFGYTLKYIHDTFVYVERYKYGFDDVNEDGDTVFLPTKRQSTYCYSKGNGFAIDVGYLFSFLGQFSIGLTAANLGPGLFAADCDTSFSLPLTLSAGVAYADTLFSRRQRPVLSLAAELRVKRMYFTRSSTHRGFGDRMHTHIGLEGRILEIVALRFGRVFYDASREENIATALNCGIGLNLMDRFGVHAVYSQLDKLAFSVTAYRLLDWFSSDE